MGQRAAFSWWDGCEETDVSACYCSMMAATCYLPHNTPRKSFMITTMATGSGLTATSMRLDLLWLSQIAMMTGTLLPAGLPDPGSLAGGCLRPSACSSSSERCASQPPNPHYRHTRGHCVSTRPPTTRLKSRQPSSEHTAQRPRCARTELAFVNVGSIGIQGT